MSEAIDDLPALSIQQPWAWLIVTGHKDIENRDWSTKYRGPILIHCGLKIDGPAAIEMSIGLHPVSNEPVDFRFTSSLMQTGGIVGTADIVDCVTASKSPWFVGRYGFVLANGRPLPFRACVGALGLFKPDFAKRYAEKPVHAKPAAPLFDAS